MVREIEGSKVGYTKLKIQVSVNSDLEYFWTLKTTTDSKFEPRFDFHTS